MFNWLIKLFVYLLKPVVREIVNQLETEKDVNELRDIINLNNAVAEKATKDKAKADYYLTQDRIKRLNKDIIKLNEWASKHRKQKEERLSKTKAKPITRINKNEDALYKRQRPQTNKEAGLQGKAFNAVYKDKF